jgi:hypothetical protein
MPQPVVYIYEVKITGQPSAYFTWPNPAKKFIRDVYTTFDGALALPPRDRLKVTRHKVNPRASHAMIEDVIDVEEWLAA